MNKKKRKTSENDQKQLEDEPQTKISKNEPQEEQIKSENTENKSRHDFDVKYFRKQLMNTKNKSSCLAQFINVCIKSEVDYAMEYLNDGGSPGEILNQLIDQRDIHLANIVFDALQLLLLKIRPSMTEMYLSAEDTCRYFLNSFTPAIETMLSDKSTQKQQISVLKLLTTIITLNTEMGLTILNQLSLKTKESEHLIARGSGKDKNEVRTAFINFIIAFLVDNNATLIKTLLDKQGLITIVIPDLIKDKPRIISAFLVLIKNNVVNNASISKTMKIRTFTHQILIDLFNIFNWKGNPQKPDYAEMKHDIDTSVSDLLFDLFTSHKLGIYFVDKLMGLGDSYTNQSLHKAIESLEGPWKNENVAALLTRIVINCPDLYQPIWKAIEEPFNPKDPEQCLKRLKFYRGIIEGISLDKVINTITEINPRHVLTFVKNLYLSIHLLKSLNDALKLSDLKIRCAALSVLFSILNCIRNYKESLELRSEDFKDTLRSVVQYFPSSDGLIGDFNISLKLSDENAAQFQIGVLNLLLLYGETIPNSLDSIVFDSALFESLDSSNTELKMKFIKFSLRIDKSAFSPNKPVFDAIITETIGALTSNQNADVFYDILDATEIFDTDRTEIDILLHTIRSNKSDLSQTILKLLKKVIDNKAKYSKAIKRRREDFVDGADFDVIFDNIANFKRTSDDLYYIRESTTMSPFIIALLDTDTDEIEPEFRRQFIVNLTHAQIDLKQIRKLLEKYNVAEIVEYINAWKSEAVHLNKNIYDKHSMVFKLTKALLKEKSIEIDDIFNSDAVLNMDSSDVKVIINTVMFYIVNQAELGVLTEIRLKNAVSVVQFIVDVVLQNERFSNKDYVDVIARSLADDRLKLKFKPLSPDDALSKFIFGVINVCNEKNVDMKPINGIIKPYRHKLYLALRSELESSTNSTKFNSDHVLSVLKLNSIDAATLIEDILKLKKTRYVTESKEPSLWVDIVTHSLSNKSIQISAEMFRKICEMYCVMIDAFAGTDLSNFELNLYEYLNENLYLIENIPPGMFATLFNAKHSSKYTPKLAALLLGADHTMLVKFFKFIVKPDVISKREFTLPVSKAAFDRVRSKEPNAALIAIYQHYKTNVWKVIEKPQKATQIYIDNVQTVVDLIHNCAEASECESFIKSVRKFDVCEQFHVDILEAVYFKSIGDGLSKYTDVFLITVFQLGVVMLKRELNHSKAQRMSRLLNKIISQSVNGECSYDKVVASSAWLNFYKHVLLAYLKPMDVPEEGFELFGTLSRIVDLIYPVDHSGIPELFGMIASHSEFLKLMLTNHYTEVKTHLVRLLRVLIRKNKTVVKSTHIPFYLSAYRGSLSERDRIILDILRYYESAGISMSEYKPYLWGDAGASHYALKTSRKKASLWSNPSTNHVLNLFDKDHIENMIKHFPIKAELNSGFTDGNCNIGEVIDDVFTFNFRKPNMNKSERVDFALKTDRYLTVMKNLDDEASCVDRLNSDELYDPSFFLPLLNYVVAPGSTVSCHRILRGGILAIPLMALSSYCPMMRAAAYNVLYRFYTLLEAELYYKKDKVLWTQFLNNLRVSLDTAILSDNGTTNGTLGPRLPAIGALYLARAALVMTNSLDPMFKPINNFAISKHHINFTIVPDFLDLFHNSDMNYLERRVWILKIIRDGIRTFSDVKLMLKSVSFKVLLDFYTSTLADVRSKSLILEILNKAVSIPKAARILTESYGLFPWLSFTIGNMSGDSKDSITVVVKLIQDLYVSLTVEKIVRSKIGDSALDRKVFKLPDGLQCQVLCLLLDFSNKLPGFKSSDLRTYLNVFRKISNENVRLVTKNQMLKLTETCCKITNSTSVFGKNLSLGIGNRKINLVINSKMLIDKPSSDNDVALQYLHEVVLNWLS